jgi:hypothetical protein
MSLGETERRVFVNRRLSVRARPSAPLQTLKCSGFEQWCSEPLSLRWTSLRQLLCRPTPIGLVSRLPADALLLVPGRYN